MTTHARNLPEGPGQPAPPPPPPDVPALLARLAAAEAEHAAAQAAHDALAPDAPLAVWFPDWDRLVAADAQLYRARRALETAQTWRGVVQLWRG